MANQPSQAMIFNASYHRNKSMEFISSAFHELLHLKGCAVLEVEKEGEDSKSHFLRFGMSINSSIKKNKDKQDHHHFIGLHEAIVTTQEKKSFHELIKNPIFEEERNIMQSFEFSNAKKDLIEKNKIPEDEIVWIYPEKKDFSSFGYVAARKTLDYVLEEIQKEFSEKYASKDDVFKEFLKAHLQGGLLTIAHLVEDTFGDGSFRLLGNMDKDTNSAITHLETLKQGRNRFLKSKEKK
jgi:hypothetical protein